LSSAMMSSWSRSSKPPATGSWRVSNPQLEVAAEPAVKLVWEPAGWRPASLGVTVSYALLDPVARGDVAYGLDHAGLQAGHNQFQPFPPPIRVQKILSLVEDPVVFDGRRHDLRVSAGCRLGVLYYTGGASRFVSSWRLTSSNSCPGHAAPSGPASSSRSPSSRRREAERKGETGRPGLSQAVGRKVRLIPDSACGLSPSPPTRTSERMIPQLADQCKGPRHAGWHACMAIAGVDACHTASRLLGAGGENRPGQRRPPPDGHGLPPDAAAAGRTGRCPARLGPGRRTVGRQISAWPRPVIRSNLDSALRGRNER